MKKICLLFSLGLDFLTPDKQTPPQKKEKTEKQGRRLSSRFRKSK